MVRLKLFLFVVNDFTRVKKKEINLIKANGDQTPKLQKYWTLPFKFCDFSFLYTIVPFDPKPEFAGFSRLPPKICILTIPLDATFETMLIVLSHVTDSLLLKPQRKKRKMIRNKRANIFCNGRSNWQRFFNIIFNYFQYYIQS